MADVMDVHFIDRVLDFVRNVRHGKNETRSEAAVLYRIFEDLCLRFRFTMA